MAASARELAFHRLYIRRPGAGIRRLFTPGLQVGGLFEKTRGDVRIRAGHRKFQAGCRLLRQIFLTRQDLVPRHYALLTAAPDVNYSLRRNPFRCESTKVNFKRACLRSGTAALVLAEQFAGFPVDEMEPGAGKANHRRIGIGFVRCRDFWQPMLHGGAQSRAFKQDMSVHVLNMRRQRLRSPPYVCVGAARMAA